MGHFFIFAMALTKEKKVAIVDKLGAALKDAQSVVFVHFKGLSVANTNAMRKELRKRGVGYTVAKKTLMRRAIAEIKPEGTEPELQGEVAIAYGVDPVVPASSIAEFAKEHADNLAIVGGIFEGRYMSQSEMRTIASIPPMQTLRGMFVNVINSPIAGLVVALNAVAEKRSA